MQSFRYSRDPDKINILIAIIPRDNLLNKKETVVCESYLPADCETVCDYWKLQTCDPPLMFGFVRLSLNPAVLLTIRTAKKKKKSLRGARAGDIGELALFLEKDIVDTIKDIQEKLTSVSLLLHHTCVVKYG